MPGSEYEHSTELKLLSRSDVLRQMHQITADREQPFERRVTDLLALGRSYLDVEVGFLTEIDERTQLVVAADGKHDLLQPGESCPLSKAYCRKTIDKQQPLIVQHAAIEGWEGDAAYERFGLESYIGATVFLEDEVYGTFCFGDSEPRDRDRPFTQSEEAFVELMAGWVGYDLMQQADRADRSAARPHR
ncbi:MAG: GAF domain-containing protein [Natronomonas sp.]